jgi:hypothetical protein
MNILINQQFIVLAHPLLPYPKRGNSSPFEGEGGWRNLARKKMDGTFSLKCDIVELINYSFLFLFLLSFSCSDFNLDKT